MAALVLGAVSIAACGLGGEANGERPPADDGAPNVILIVLDDATAEMVTPTSMPNTTRELAWGGTRFESFIAVSPLCCPARANLLTGQYGHNNGVLRNHYKGLRKKSQILPSWLQAAGYRTLHVGKYLNGYTKGLEKPTDTPWGWDEWFTLIDNGYYDYTLSDNGKLREYGDRPDDYVTRVINRKAVELIEDHEHQARPFFMQIDHFAPHPRPTRDKQTCESGSLPDPDDLEGVKARAITGKTSRNEADVGDKPSFVRAQERMTGGELAKAKRNYKCAVASLAAVDRGFAGLMSALRRTGQLDRTAIFFTSDNGYFFGEHRLPAKKEFAYEENLRMPLLVRMPEVSAAKRRPRAEALAGMIDLAPTILALAGTDSCDQQGRCRKLDGRSLLPILTGEDGPDRWPQQRTLLIELKQSPSGKQSRARPCSYLGVRTAARTYVQHREAAAPGTRCRGTDEVELYDLKRDPEQLRNLHGKRESEERELRRLVGKLEDCEGNVTAPDPGPNPCQ